MNEPIIRGFADDSILLSDCVCMITKNGCLSFVSYCSLDVEVCEAHVRERDSHLIREALSRRVLCHHADK